MRVKQPEPFDPNREYRPGERCVYRGMVLIAEIWTAADARLANNNPAIFTQRCVRCKIQREDCPGQSKPEKICGTCRYFNPEYPINGKPRPVCLALKETKDGHTYKITLGVEPHFHCSNGKYENGIGR